MTINKQFNCKFFFLSLLVLIENEEKAKRKLRNQMKNQKNNRKRNGMTENQVERKTRSRRRSHHLHNFHSFSSLIQIFGLHSLSQHTHLPCVDFHLTWRVDARQPRIISFAFLIKAQTRKCDTVGHMNRRENKRKVKKNARERQKTKIFLGKKEIDISSLVFLLSLVGVRTKQNIWRKRKMLN